MENAWPIEAAKFTAPFPNKGMTLQQRGAELTSHIKNKQ